MHGRAKLWRPLKTNANALNWIFDWNTSTGGQAGDVTVKTVRHPSTIHYNNYSRDKMKACITDSKSLDDKNDFLLAFLS